MFSKCEESIAGKINLLTPFSFALEITLSMSSLNLSKRYKGIDNKGVNIYYSIVEDEVLPFLQQISDEVIF